MLERLAIRTFKSLEDVTIDLGQVNVFIGANGSGKSNLLEALGILSAAADGRVDDQALLTRGVRPGSSRAIQVRLSQQVRAAYPATSIFRCRGGGSQVRGITAQSTEATGPCLEIQDRTVGERRVCGGRGALWRPTTIQQASRMR